MKMKIELLEIYLFSCTEDNSYHLKSLRGVHLNHLRRFYLLPLPAPLPFTICNATKVNFKQKYPKG